MLTFDKNNNDASHCTWKVPKKEQFVLNRVKGYKSFQNLMFLFSIGTNERSVPPKIALRPQFVNI